ncbi:MAG: TIGR01777 family oxidoreductase [Rhodococcus sp. (in: high G+C Gram-positive bacteria)]
MKTVFVTGAWGYIGQSLVRALEPNGVDVRTIGRGGTSDATWSDEQGVADVLSGADLLINLAGRSVSCRYNKRNADEIFSSRVETTALLGRALARTPQPPSLWANASTGTIYRDARDRLMDEKNGELGKGFSVAVARAWEHELFSAPTPVRKVALRMSIVLGAGGGAINPFVNLARTGFGGRMGDGRQKFSWIHISDVVRSIIHIYEHPEISGPVNIASPCPVTNDEMMRQVRAALGRRYGAPTPGWMLEFGARIIRTEAELVLKSRWVSPGVLADSGFQYQFPTLESALEQIAQETPRGLLPVTLG